MNKWKVFVKKKKHLAWKFFKKNEQKINQKTQNWNFRQNLVLLEHNHIPS